MLDSDLQTIVTKMYKQDEANEINFGGLSERSKSLWDHYIQELTPDLPSFIPDALEVFLRMRGFEEFWRRVNKELSLEQRERLIEWYRSTARSLGAPDGLLAFLD
jgi:hypothetical protein